MVKNNVIKKQIVFYLWLGLIFLLLWTWHDMTSFDATLLHSLLNNAWRIPFVMIVNFLFLEYTIPFVLQKRYYVLYNVLLGIVTLWLFMILWSFGLYGWRGIGVALHVYTPLGPYGKPANVITAQMAFSASSVIFFGLIRHAY